MATIVQRTRYGALLQLDEKIVLSSDPSVQHMARNVLRVTYFVGVAGIRPCLISADVFS